MSVKGDSQREVSTPAEVDRIRDIIFGPQMRVYEQQFKRFSGRLDALKIQMEELRASLDQRWTEATTASKQADAEIRDEVRKLREELSSRGDQQSAELKSQIDRLAADVRKQGQDLHAKLAEAVDALEHSKASRENVGDLLIEMGSRLKQQLSITDLLGQLQDSSEEAPSEEKR